MTIDNEFIGNLVRIESYQLNRIIQGHQPFQFTRVMRDRRPRVKAV
jgi:hypothetical protein